MSISEWKIKSLEKRVMTLEALYNALIDAIKETNPELHKSFLNQPLPKDIPIMTQEEEETWNNPK